MSKQNIKNVMPAMKRINESTTSVVNELSWIKENSPSTRARNQAGKAILSFETGEIYSEKAFTLHELKESQSEEQHGVNSKQRYRNQRLQNQES